MNKSHTSSIFDQLIFFHMRYFFLYMKINRLYAPVIIAHRGSRSIMSYFRVVCWHYFFFLVFLSSTYRISINRNKAIYIYTVWYPITTTPPSDFRGSHGYLGDKESAQGRIRCSNKTHAEASCACRASPPP